MARRHNPYVGDPATRRARSAGYAARSVFKLEELDRRLGLLGPRRRVLDLGAAPGSWTQYAAARVGRSGRVIAVDLVPIAIELPAWVTTLTGDALDIEGAVAQFAPFDVVLSDMAPKTSGSRVRDQELSRELFVGALEVASRLGRPGSSFIGKLFMSQAFSQVREAVAGLYTRCRVMRPAGTRPNSAEVFLAGLELRLGAPLPGR
ncbi:MAG: RlmE family RNA methyltransferase [Polyangiaceae bacterium]|nr:RlmE family RNA methyltransferase [Polyangiaceae bacterium]